MRCVRNNCIEKRIMKSVQRFVKLKLIGGNNQCESDAPKKNDAPEINAGKQFI